jgi:hypothetical protein
MISSSSILLSTAYLPPIQYITKFLIDTPVLIEKHENYQKQSYRNRCYIYGANGKQCLVIPVKKQHGEKTPVSEVEIEYKENWQKIHLKSIGSAYRLSAFYEYYADDFKAFYKKETRLLFEWNLDMLFIMLQFLGIQQVPALTYAWEQKPDNRHDFRQGIHPKSRLAQPDMNFTPLPYQQVFQERYGFLPNLSIIDLLFNEGPLAVSVLRKSVKSNDFLSNCHTYLQ